LLDLMAIWNFTYNGSTTQKESHMNTRFWFSVLSVTFVMAGCTKNSSSTSPASAARDNWPTISGGTAVSATHRIRAEILSKDSLHEGYDSLAVVLRDSVSGKVITNANVGWFPEMNMGTMHHSAPVDNYNSAAGADSLFRAGILFIMASDSMDGWTLRVRVDDRRYDSLGVFNDSIDFPVWVRSVSPSPLIWWKGPDSLNRVAAILSPKIPVTGTNTLELFIGRSVTMLDWRADSAWTVSFVPTMPTMDNMTSPNNVDPTATGGAHYKGKVNFNMSGFWRLTFTFRQTTSSFVAADTSQYYDVTVK
jgi:hypothetical protein